MFVYTNIHNSATNSSPPLPGINRATIVKILGVTVTNSQSVAPHVHAVVGCGAQTLLPFQCFEVTGWTTRNCRPYFGQLPSPDCSTRRAPGGGSPWNPSDSELMRLFAAVQSLSSCRRTSSPLLNCAKHQMEPSSITLFETPNMSSTTFCRLKLIPLKITICDSESIISSCHLAQPTSLTAASSIDFSTIY